MATIRKRPKPEAVKRLREVSKRLSDAWTGLERFVQSSEKRFGQAAWTHFDDSIRHAREAACALDEEARVFEEEGLETDVPPITQDDVAKRLDGFRAEIRSALDGIEDSHVLLDNDEVDGPVNRKGVELLFQAKDTLDTGLGYLEAALKKFGIEMEDGNDALLFRERQVRA